MSEAKGQHEPSMEEILASIRRIIAEDGDAPAAPAAEEKSSAHQMDEILELTEVVEDDGTVVSLTAGAQIKPVAEPPASKRPPPSSDGGLDTPSPPMPRIVPDPEPPPPPKPVPMSDDTANRLVSGATAAASVASLSQLGALGQRDRPGDIALGELGRTLEEVVRELLRPLLKDWLDANLPYLVERLVQEEIQRMVREAQGR